VWVVWMWVWVCVFGGVSMGEGGVGCDGW
jgi:hypothetical protein